jgi:hypothetical protein
MKTPMTVYFAVFITMTATFQLVALATSGHSNLLLSAIFSIPCVLFFAAIDTWFYDGG